MKKIDDSLNKAKTSYTGAIQKLHTGRGSVMSIAERMKNMGIKTNKQIEIETISEIPET
jgi:DNA anti-recombination protein RmuC